MSEAYVSRQEATSAYTYEVTLVVQVLAGSQAEADKQLEAQGGYVSSRRVKFLRTTPVYDAPLEESLDKAFEKIVGEQPE